MCIISSSVRKYKTTFAAPMRIGVPKLARRSMSGRYNHGWKTEKRIGASYEGKKGIYKALFVSDYSHLEVQSRCCKTKVC